MPKYIAAADLHISSARPRYRKDNYEEACCTKLKWIVQFADSKGATLLIAGDIFDSPRISWELFNKVIDIFKSAKQTPLIVHGQHDVRYHDTDLNCSPLSTLHRTSLLHLLDEKPCYTDHNVCFWGAGFERPIPVVKKEAHRVDILLVHKCITKEIPPFYLPDALSSKEMLRKYRDFDLIVSGDFHESFQTVMSDRHLLNCGPMMRKNKDQALLQPQVFFIDTDERTYKSCLIPVKPIESF